MAKQSEIQKAIEESLGIKKGEGWLKSIAKEVLGVKDGKDAAKQTAGLKDKRGDK